MRNSNDYWTLAIQGLLIALIVAVLQLTGCIDVFKNTSRRYSQPSSSFPREAR